MSSPENPLIAFVLLPVSLSSVSLPLMKLQMNWPPPSCLSLSLSLRSARSPACVVSPHVSPAFTPHVFVSPPPALLADFSIHPPPPFFLTVLKPFLISCFHASIALLSHFHSSCLFCLSGSLLIHLSFFCVNIFLSFTCMEGRDVANVCSPGPGSWGWFLFSTVCVFHDVSTL